jgi:hypothetical protein
MITNRKSWATAFVVGITLLGILIVLRIMFSGGIRVTIQNTGRKPLGSVKVYVTGTTHNLGDIAAGATAEVVVNATGESHLEIEFIDTEGQTERLNAGGYFESSYRGTIRVSIKDGVIDKNEQQITISPYL